MSYHHKKTHPDLALVRRQAKSAGLALEKLSRLGIAVQKIDFTGNRPLVEVANCPSTINLHSNDAGQGRNSEQGRYVTRSSVVCECLIIWRE
ncbi:MAG: hypothetical protein ACXW1W_02850, partial [Methylococcaceae bacterium]